MNCSVLLPVYNAGSPLRRAIESILLQSDAHFEFLIIDDCSSDGSPELIRRYAASDSRIRPIFHQKNSGLASTLNEGLREAQSDLVVRMDQDDIALPGRLTTQIRHMRDHPDIAVAGSFVFHMGRSARYDRLVRVPVEHQEIAATLPKYNCLYHPSVILDRKKIVDLGGYRPEYKNAEDYDLWLRVSKVYRLANIPVPLLRYRFSSGGMTLGRKWQQALFAQMAVVSHFHPEWDHETVVNEAQRELEKLGKAWFLEQVTRGTISELNALRHYGDAWRVFGRFWHDLKPLSAWRVFQELVYYQFLRRRTSQNRR